LGATSKSGYAPVNGLDMYYEVHGEGVPLILLHGGIAASEAFGDNLPLLAKDRQVIAVHLQGHGHTRDIDRPLRYELMADDVAAVMAHLGLEQADLLGYSMGGGVALQVAIRHPHLVRKLVVISMTMSRDGSYPDVLAIFDQMATVAPQIAANVAQSPLASMYPHINWEVSFRKMSDMVTQEYDWSADVAGITAPVLLVYADADSIRPEHMVEFWKALGGGQRDAGLDGSQRPVSRLAIVPGATHYDILGTTTVGEYAASFLDA
jgi:pimeloyl-ACP methyl ester carboxylesterase